MSHEPRTMSRFNKGFTSVELIIVMLVLGMLAVSFAIKNPFSIQDYSSIAADQLIADIRYVQMRAMGLGSPQSIIILTANLYTVAGEQKNLPNGTTMSVATFTFNSLGEPTTGGDVKVTVGGSQYIKVFDITGYVCKCKNSACNASECLN